MGGVVCKISGEGRHCLSTLLMYLNLKLAASGDVLLLIGLYLKLVLERQLSVVLGSHGGAISYFLIVVGAILCCVCLFTAKIAYDAGTVETATRRTCKMLLLAVVCQGVTLLLVFACIIMCLVHKSLIREALRTGVMEAMRLYRTNPRIKAGVDMIQSSFQCCGSHGSDDWFKLPWIRMKYLNVDHPDVERYMVNGDFIKDDAPYSCCDVHVARPCVHHDVHNTSAHKQMGPTGTLYSTGCNNRLEDYWKAAVLNPILGILTFETFLLVLSMMLSRMLQTSLDEALVTGDPTGDGEAYCFKPCSCVKDLTTAADQSEEKPRKSSFVGWCVSTLDTCSFYTTSIGPFIGR